MYRVLVVAAALLSSCAGTSPSPKEAVPVPDADAKTERTRAPQEGTDPGAESAASAPSIVVAPVDDEARDLRTIERLREAFDQYQAFIERAESDPSFEQAVERSRERRADIRAEIEFLEHGVAERRMRTGEAPNPGE